MTRPAFDFRERCLRLDTENKELHAERNGLIKELMAVQAEYARLADELRAEKEARRTQVQAVERLLFLQPHARREG
jgi:hypothetical protein